MCFFVDFCLLVLCCLCVIEWEGMLLWVVFIGILGVLVMIGFCEGLFVIECLFYGCSDGLV